MTLTDSLTSALARLTEIEERNKKGYIYESDCAELTALARKLLGIVRDLLADHILDLDYEWRFGKKQCVCGSSWPCVTPGEVESCLSGEVSE